MIAKSKAKLLLIGCGDIGIRLASRLDSRHYDIYGLRRNVASLPNNIVPLPCDLNDVAEVRTVLQSSFDYVVITLTPADHSEQAYRQSYGTNMETLLGSLQQHELKPRRIFFVSSTSVYGQDQGQRVDESSATEPNNYRGQWVLAAEHKLLSSSLSVTIVRFSGIYGPGRKGLVAQIKQGNWRQREHQWTNRIHSDDCAGVLAWLLRRGCRDESLQQLYLASDGCPAINSEVCQWLAKKLSAPEPSASSVSENDRGRGLNKRCSNQRLRDTGFEFRYPSYREGYSALLENYSEV